MSDLFPTVKHHSASSINSFIGQRASWYNKYYLGNKEFTPSKHAARGNAVEAALNYWTQEKEPNIQEAIKVAHAEFVSKTNGLDVEIEFRSSINKLVNTAIAAFSERYKSEDCEIQKKIHFQFDDLEIPILGFLDFSFNKLIVDCKITGKTPSKLSQEHIIQGSLYKKATGKEVEFFYVIPLADTKKEKDRVTIKPIALTNQDYESGLKLAKQALYAMERLYKSAADGLDLRAAFFPDPSKLWPSDKAAILKEFGMDVDDTGSESDDIEI